MATNLSIDTELLNEAFIISGLKTKRETVNQALIEYVQKHKKQEIIAFFGNFSADEEYDYKKGRLY